MCQELLGGHAGWPRRREEASSHASLRETGNFGKGEKYVLCPQLALHLCTYMAKKLRLLKVGLIPL